MAIKTLYITHTRRYLKAASLGTKFRIIGYPGGTVAFSNITSHLGQIYSLRIIQSGSRAQKYFGAFAIMMPPYLFG
jgi:hypothetical protein